jgi:hypothetical protein
MALTTGSSARPTEIMLMGERGFPAVHTDVHDIVDDLTDLSLSASTTALVERWMELVANDRDDEQDDTLLAAVRAAAAVKRDVGSTVRVSFQMRYPRLGDWIGFDASDYWGA